MNLAQPTGPMPVSCAFFIYALLICASISKGALMPSERFEGGA